MWWCHWWCHWHNVTLILVSSHDQESCCTSFWISWPKWWCNQHHVMLSLVPLGSNDPKSHVAPHLDFLDLRNAMVPLMMLSASCDTCTDGVALSYYTSFWSSWPKEYNGCIDYIVSILWCWCWHQWYNMTKTFMLHLILIIWT